MRLTPTWLLAGTAFAAMIAAGAAVANERTAQREAAEDSANAPKIERRTDDRRVHIHTTGSRTDYLAEALKLRPDQRPALDALMAATRGGDRPQRRTASFDREPGRTTLQRLDDMQARMAEEQGDANRRIAAIRAFYGQLNADQKKAFDEMPILMVVGLNVGPMMIPQRMSFAQRMPAPPMPPLPPEPPEPPAPPRF